MSKQFPIHAKFISQRGTLHNVLMNFVLFADSAKVRSEGPTDLAPELQLVAPSNVGPALRQFPSPLGFGLTRKLIALSFSSEKGM